MNNYFLDFARINELTSCKSDDTSEGYAGTFFYGISRKIVKKYLYIFLGEVKVTDNERTHVIETLVYNGILIHKSIIREKRIDDIINE